MDERPHWNEVVPGYWHGPRSVKGVGSYIGNYVNARRGVYRLIAMADMATRTPMILNRIAGHDETGTLYIGSAYDSTVRFRLQQLVRSLRPRRGSGEHSVGGRIQSPLLGVMFPRECLAVTWAYEKHSVIFEDNLLGHYFQCFGETPPLNHKPGKSWFDVPDDEASE